MPTPVRVWTPANIVTMTRIGAFPLIMGFCYLEHYAHGEETKRLFAMLSMLVFVIAFLSDILDGYIARSRNEVTTLGKFLDPLSDKLVMVAALVMLVRFERAPAWAAVLIILREIAVTGLRTLASVEGLVISASAGGKLKTVVQVIAVACLLFSYKRHFLGIIIDFDFWGEIVLYIALVITLWSGFDYFKAFFTAHKPEDLAG